MQRRSPGSENVVDMRVNPAATTGSRVRTLLQHDLRWLEEMGLNEIADALRAENRGTPYTTMPPTPADRYIPLTPEITRAAHDLFSETDMRGSPITLPQRRWEQPRGR